METKYDLKEMLKLFPIINEKINFYKKHNKDIDEIIQIHLYTKHLIDDFSWFLEYFLQNDIKENLLLPYAIISHFAWWYFSISNDISLKSRIEKEIDNFILNNFEIKEMKYLLLSGFFESYAFDSKEKYKYFLWKLSVNSKIILEKYLEN